MSPLVGAVVAIIVIDYFARMAIESLNMTAMKAGCPDEFKDVYSRERYEKSQDYLKAQTCFGLMKNTFFTIVTLFVILSGGIAGLDVWVRGRVNTELTAGLLYIGVLGAGLWVLDLPFAAYRVFVLEERFGFNKTTLTTFVTDNIKGFCLSFFIGGILLFIVIEIFLMAAGLAWLLAWAAVAAVQFIIMFVSPVLLLPIYNKLVRLEPGTLKKAVEDYLDRQCFKAEGLYTMDASRRSSKSNAFFIGFGRTRRVVFYDTLIEKHGVDELLAILAHEIGHYKKKHILTQFSLNSAGALFVFYFLGAFLNFQPMYHSFHLKNSSIHTGLLLFSFIYGPMGLALGVISNYLSRCHEAEADRYAVETTGGKEHLILALKKLSADNMSNLTPHPVKVVADYSHPPIVKRIQAIGRIPKGR